MRLFKCHPRSVGDGKIIEKEKLISEISFNKFKFNKRIMPSKENIVFITCFGEFGCESIGLMYCIPKVIQQYPDAYIVCVGWYGREYLYRHLVDEFWELKEEFQYLREYSNAFQNTSKSIKKLENVLRNDGIVVESDSMGKMCLGTYCKSCGNFWNDNGNCCPKCNSVKLLKGILNNIPFHKKLGVSIPRPSIKYLNLAKKYLKPNSVGIFARGRTCYGRNLSSDFYTNLISLLENMGYNPIWLGEKQSVLECPVDHITDFSRLPESRDLELTLSIIANLEFTVQCWTASTRFASMVGTPWILMESPDQIVGNGQEGMRIALTTDFNKKKIILAQYKNVKENEIESLTYIKQAIKEIHEDNWENIIGPVDHDITNFMLKKQELWR